MKWKSFGWFQTFLFCILIPSLAWAMTFPARPYVSREATHSINIRYQSTKRFPSLQKKVGSTVGIAPVKDTRHDRYVGHYVHQRVSNHLRSEPFPLDNAIRDSLHQFLSLHGIKTVPISNWDGKEKSLKNTGADSILMIEIMRFWAEGMVSGRGTKVNTSIYLTIRLGIKKKNRVFTRNLYTIKESSTVGLTPAGAEQMINQALTEILDAFFSDPY